MIQTRPRKSDPKTTVLQLKLTFEQTNSVRRIQVPVNNTFYHLHCAIKNLLNDYNGDSHYFKGTFRNFGAVEHVFMCSRESYIARQRLQPLISNIFWDENSTDIGKYFIRYRAVGLSYVNGTTFRMLNPRCCAVEVEEEKSTDPSASYPVIIE